MLITSMQARIGVKDPIRISITASPSNPEELLVHKYHLSFAYNASTVRQSTMSLPGVLQAKAGSSYVRVSPLLHITNRATHLYIQTQ